MPGCGDAGASFGSARACPGGFWRAGRRAREGGQAAKIAADASGGERPGLTAAFPALPVILGYRAGQAQLGEAAKDQPGPAAHLIRLAERGFVPAQGGLGEPVAVLDVEPVQAGAPDQVQVRHARVGPPQPQRPGDLSPVRQAFYGDADEMALDDGRPGEAGITPTCPYRSSCRDSSWSGSPQVAGFCTFEPAAAVLAVPAPDGPAPGVAGPGT